METELCGRCSKPVFFAEERVAGGKKWHATCFKCGLCKRSLESTILATFEGNVFCKHCYGRKYGPKGYGFGVGAGVLGMDHGEHVGNTDTPISNKPHDMVPPGLEESSPVRDEPRRGSTNIDERRGSGLDRLRRDSQSSRRGSGQEDDDN